MNWGFVLLEDINPIFWRSKLGSSGDGFRTEFGISAEAQMGITMKELVLRQWQASSMVVDGPSRISIGMVGGLVLDACRGHQGSGSLCFP